MVGVTGVGSLPGTDYPAAVRLVFDTLGSVDNGLPHLPELPARGPWAGLIGRACGLLVDLPVSFDAGVWRLSDATGIDGRRARATLRDDLDMLQEQAHEYAGRFKVQVTGPWTLAASVFRPLGGRVLADRGARRDVAQSIAAGVRDLVADVERRLPGVEVLVQVDEPALPAVLAGAVPTEGGYFRHRAVDRPEAVELLRELGGHVLHCCAPGLDVGLVLGPHGAGFTGVALDQDLLSRAAWDALAPLVEDGKELWLGAAPTASGVPLSADALTRRVLGALRPLELGPVVLDRVVLTPACGLAGWTPAAVSAVLRALRTTAERMDEELSR